MNAKKQSAQSGRAVASQSDDGSVQQDGVLQIQDPPRIDPAFLAPVRGPGVVPDGLLLASKANEPLPILVPIPPVEIGPGETHECEKTIRSVRPYGSVAIRWWQCPAGWSTADPG
ncbi:hypothetical protein, partial [Burkholderia ubonensis]|uniref:hypothetical protein n=1 Tax=Burkholderia ubonensis TaxID=101571 RepID=UPI001C42F031